jgi:hypothetical protein
MNAPRDNWIDDDNRRLDHDFARGIRSSRCFALGVLQNQRSHMSVINYDHHSAHSINLFCASTAMWVLEKMLGLRQRVGAPAHRGVAVENGVTHGLTKPDAPPSGCASRSPSSYDTLWRVHPRAAAKGIRQSIEDMVRLALGELRTYGVASEGATRN